MQGRSRLGTLSTVSLPTLHNLICRPDGNPGPVEQPEDGGESRTMGLGEVGILQDLPMMLRCAMGAGTPHPRETQPTPWG